MAQSALFLRNLWYMAMPGQRLKPGKMVAKRLLGEALLLGRGKDAKPFALRNLCPHRGVPLSYGRFDGTEI
ncbi:MAG: Rieske 2Fe-2S domain-containing protein, partial [Candidatus Tectomicrobia bacterium]